MRLIISVLLIALSVSGPVFGQKKVLDHNAYDIWNRFEERHISHNGEWIGYVAGPEDKDNILSIINRNDQSTLQIDRGHKLVFSNDNDFAAAMIAPAKAEIRAAKMAKIPKEQMPKDSLAIFHLRNGNIEKIARIKSFDMPVNGQYWIAYALEAPLPNDSLDTSAAETTPPQKPAGKSDVKNSRKKKRSNGTQLVIRHLLNGDERRIENVLEYVFTDNGSWLIYTAANADSSADGIYAVVVATGEQIPIVSGAGDYTKPVLDKAGTQVAFLSNRNHYNDDQPAWSLYHWSMENDKPQVYYQQVLQVLPTDYWISDNGDLFFSEDGKKLFFGVASRPEPEVEDSLLEDEKVGVEIWAWTDPIIQPMQQKNREKELKKSFPAVLHLKKKKIVMLGSEDLPEIIPAQKGDGNLAMAITGRPYRKLLSWDYPNYYDIYLVDMQSGQRQRVLQKVQFRPRLSPEGRYLYWWDRDLQQWKALETRRPERVINLSDAIDQTLAIETHDWPYEPNAYGSPGWVAGDKAIIIYDSYDIWSVDPKNPLQPRNITNGFGRESGQRLRYIALDPEQPALSATGPWLLSTFHLKDKRAGFYQDSWQGGSEPVELLRMARYFSKPEKAKNAKFIMFSQSSYQEFPDLWTAKTDLSDRKKITALNPQKDDYNWGSAALMSWRSLDGAELQGILYRPEDFDPVRKYPMIVYFYEKNSNNFHRHWAPAAHRSIINPTFYASRGYLVFVPDIPYKIGYPGESAINAVMPGVTQLISEGFVDPDNIGVQGHSWGGYQIAYMVTRSNLFKCAAAGAPVSNMVSAYGGIRWRSGRSRMFQYERTQSRIGGALWEYPMRYIENSPIFWADKVETPLLIMHNDQDGAVPWYQGIELFVALRRLNKPVWLVNYSGEPHWPVKFPKKRDWQIRLQQYFDHYLKGAPAAEWLMNGIPATLQDKTLGLEPVVAPE